MSRQLVMFAVLVALAPHARAAPAGAQAEALFRQGQDLLRQGKIAEACAAFDASEKLDPTIATLLNQASCREKNGQLATAWGEYLEAERQTRSATDAAGRQFHKTAGDRARALEPRLSTLKINIAPDDRVAGLEILRDGDLVDAGAWNQPLPIDGGTYKIAARAPGHAEWTSTIAVGAERDAKSIDIPKLAPMAVAPPPPPKPDAPRSVAPTSPHAASKLPFVIGGAALALVGGAVGFELWGDSTYDRAKRATDAQTQLDLWHSANAKRYLAEGMGVAALGCAGVAIWLYVRGPGSSADERVVLGPALLHAGAGLSVSGRY